jgi:hypothetical protein
MNRLTANLLAVAMVLSTVVSTRASTGTTNDPSFQPLVNHAALTAPTVLSQKVALNSTELAKYQQKTEQSQVLAKHEAAGGTGKTVAIVVVAVVVVAAVVALAASHGGSSVSPMGA